MRKDRLSWSRSSESEANTQQNMSLERAGVAAPGRGSSNSTSSRVVLRQGASRQSSTTSIASGCGIKGELYFSGVAEINCRIEGEIASEGQLIIGESAQISAGIRAEALIVFGAIEGDIVCSQRIELHSGARVRGSICSPRIVMQDGVHFEGDCITPSEDNLAQSSEDDQRVAND